MHILTHYLLHWSFFCGRDFTEPIHIGNFEKIQEPKILLLKLKSDNLGEQVLTNRLHVFVDHLHHCDFPHSNVHDADKLQGKERKTKQIYWSSFFLMCMRCRVGIEGKLGGWGSEW